MEILLCHLSKSGYNRDVVSDSFSIHTLNLAFIRLVYAQTGTVVYSFVIRN